MGEIKSVKVDNWGVFFLQKLQNFFNKTDYCDLTLQFNDNSQLKVHRLVLSACTDYFNVLEQTCEMVDDALIMPNELQADVVVPIVNFMYTGTLEFELKMYGKLLRTAKEMNMTVLLKLLEAHRRTMEGVNRSQGPASPKSIRKRGTVPTIPTATQMRPLSNSSPQQHRRILSNSTAQRRPVQMKTISTNVPQSQVVQYRQALGTSLLTTSTSASVSSHKNQHTTYEATSNTGDAGAYEPTMQFKEEQHDDYETQLSVNNQSTSPFEQLRKGYNNNKRPASATFISPPAKKPNIEDVKEFAEQQRMRKQIAAEYGEDQEYESTMLDDDIHNDDDDDDTAAPISSSSLPTLSSSSTAIRQQQHISGPSIIIKQEPNEKPTIVVKDSSNSKVNHAKIISEVLRQYPHLVKSNKNIKLKIMPNVGGQSQKIIVKKEQIDNISADLKIQTVTPTTCTSQTLLKSAKTHEKSDQAQMQRAQKQASVAPTVVSAGSASQNTPPSGAPTQKRRIDSKTMHALIALGAENTSGPWLCLRCGVNGRPISIPSYRGFRRHLINTHKETIDTSLCEHCGWRSTSNRELHFHIQIEHKIKSSVYMFSECLSCSEFFIDSCALSLHKIDSHPEENQQQCIYCNKIFAKEFELYTHMKTYHKKQAIDDGIIDYSDADDEDEQMDTQETTVKDSVDEKPDSPSSGACNKNKKIKILSDISIPSASTLMKLEPSTSTANLDKIASGIATSAAVETVSEPKFVTVDGNEMMLTDEQRKEIMSQLNQEHEGGVVMVLNESVFAGSGAASTETNEEASPDDSPQSAEPTANLDHETEEQPTTGASINEDEEYDDSNIYDEFVSKVEIENKKEVSSLDESKGSTDNLEWAENLLTAHELEDEDTSKTEPKQTEENDRNANDRKIDEDISRKLKELTGDWTDDEIEDDNEEEDEVNAKPLHKEFELKEEHREDTGESSIVQDAKELQKAPEVEKCLNVKTEKTDNLSEDDEKIESTETKDDREHQRVDDREDGPEDVCEYEREDDREDYIDSALEGLHKEVEIEAGNDKTHVAAATTSNGKESDDTLASQEVPNKDLSLGLISDVSSSLTEEIAVATKHCEKILCENEKDEIETELPEDKEELSKLVLSEENNVKPSIKESNLRVDAEIRNTAELEAIKGEEKKDGVTEIKIEEPAIPPTEFVTPTSKTEEKIKTLISEWGDDDDDDDDDDAVEDLGTVE